MKEAIIEIRNLKNIDFLDKAFFSDFLEVTKKLNISEVHLTGGEPSLHTKIDYIIRKLKENGLIAK
ncbi:hypothetical protein [Staphylococcus pseudintermedius]|uniref:hypothetical protein n=1 Tax=Staphylococcus pseudintermedius TaxID=283734 RepID=UPI003F657E45